MLMSLTSLSDEEIEAVTAAVSQWCKANHCQIDSSEGRRAIAIAIDVVQLKPGIELSAELHRRMRQLAVQRRKMIPIPPIGGRHDSNVVHYERARR